MEATRGCLPRSACVKARAPVSTKSLGRAGRGLLAPPSPRGPPHALAVAAAALPRPPARPRGAVDPGSAGQTPPSRADPSPPKSCGPVSGQLQKACGFWQEDWQPPRGGCDPKQNFPGGLFAFGNQGPPQGLFSGLWQAAAAEEPARAGPMVCRRLPGTRS